MGFLSGLAKAVGGGVSGVAKGVAHAASDVVDVGKKVVTNPLSVVPKLPGAALNAALWLPHTAVQAGGKALELGGKLTGSESLENLGETVQSVDRGIIKATLNRPVEAAEILGGSVLIATGIAAPAGAGLLGKGVTGIAAETVLESIPRPADGPTVGAPVPVKPPATAVPVPSMAAAAAAPPPPGGGLLERLIEWVRDLLT